MFRLRKKNREGDKIDQLLHLLERDPENTNHRLRLADQYLRTGNRKSAIQEYQRVAKYLGNEGFNLDPPRVDSVNGEMANFDKTPQSRTAADPRHLNRASVLWLDGHTSGETLEGLGYRVRANGGVGFDGDNTNWSGTGRDIAWTTDLSR